MKTQSLSVAAICIAVALAACANTNNASPGGDGDSGDVAACNDGIDNDGDGLVDFPEDPGCGLGLEDSEDDDCPDGPLCPACANGIDDDGDGAADYPADSGCDSANDGNELAENPAACGGGVKLETLEGDVVMGTVESSGASGLKSNGCGGSGGEVAYTFAVTRPSSLVISTDFPETKFDTVIYLRSSCGNEGSELGCNDDAPDAEGNGSTLIIERVEPGEYYVIVDGQFQGAGGDFKLEVKSYVGRDEACTSGVDDCAPGLLCQHPMGTGMATCVPPRCSDGIDNDGDGAIDYPVEPGCPGPDANDENDNCPSGPNCAQCSNGIDDDNDGFIDGDDIGCGAAGDDVEEDCEGEMDAILSITDASLTGATDNASDDFVPSCSTFSTAPDIVHVLSVPGRLLSLHADTSGSDFDSMLYIKSPECASADLDCDDQSGGNGNAAIDLSDVAAGTYYLIVDGWSSNSGNYTLNVNGVLAAGQACDPAMTDVFSCQSGYACVNGMCAEAACNDGVDGDGDGVADYPGDPGCDSPSDPDETDDCPSGANCPACSNGSDDDGDGVSDYGNDPGCGSASDNDEEDCGTSTDGLITIDMPATMGTTSGATNDMVPSCRSTSTAPDHVHRLSVPGELESLTVDTNGSSFDTVLYIRPMTCEAMDMSCDDDGGETTRSLITESNLAAGDYFIVVDGYSQSSGNYVLNVSGVIKAGEACDADQVSAGIFSCGGGTSCTSGMCQ